MSQTSQEGEPGSRRAKTKRERRRCACWCAEAGGPHGGRGALLAEAAGAALLVLLTCLPACAGAPPALRPLAAGLAVALLVQCFDHISGAMFNPTVLLAAWLARRLRASAAAALLAAQLAGAAAGGGLLLALAPAGTAPDANAACLTLPREDLSVYKAVGIEAVLGGLLALANHAAWDARARGADSWPLRVGLSVAGLSAVAGELTGASMNPARSLAPALWSARWEHHWVYWAGPLGGSLLCSLLYRAAWALPPAPLPSAAPARARAGAAPGGDKTHCSV